MIETIKAGLGDKSIVLVGMMGAGKTAIGRRLAHKLDLEFRDADHEIEAAAGKSISDIFEEHGEAYFRDGERRVIRRLLGYGSQVLATGGGAIMDEKTRAGIVESAISIWLNADIDVLIKRVSKRGHRPLLKGTDVGEKLRQLMDVRGPIYEQSNIVIKSRDVPHDVIIGELIDDLANFYGHR